MKFNVSRIVIVGFCGFCGLVVLAQVVHLLGDQAQFALMPDSKEFKVRGQRISQWLYDHPEGLPKTDREALAAGLCGRANGVTILLNRTLMGLRTQDIPSSGKHIVLIGTQEEIDGCSYTRGSLISEHPGRYVAVLFTDGTDSAGTLKWANSHR